MDPVQEFLDSQREGSLESSGRFSKREGREALLVPVTELCPDRAVLFAVRAALSGGATKLHYRRGATSVMKIPTYGFTLHDNAPGLTPNEIRCLLDGDIYHNRRLHHLAFVLRAPTQWRTFEAIYLFGSQQIVWDKDHFRCQKQPSVLSPLNKRDLLGRNTMIVSSKKLQLLDFDGWDLRDAARYCRLPVRVGSWSLNGKLKIPPGSPAHQIWHNQKTPIAIKAPVNCNQGPSPGSYSAVLWIEPKVTNSSKITLLDEGLISQTIVSKTSHPGWEAVVWAENWSYDLNGDIRRDEYFEDMMNKLNLAANQLVGID
jgi:hypothetical protein